MQTAFLDRKHLLQGVFLSHLTYKHRMSGCSYRKSGQMEYDSRTLRFRHGKHELHCTPEVSMERQRHAFRGVATYAAGRLR